MEDILSKDGTLFLFLCVIGLFKLNRGTFSNIVAWCPLLFACCYDWVWNVLLLLHPKFSMSKSSGWTCHQGTLSLLLLKGKSFWVTKEALTDFITADCFRTEARFLMILWTDGNVLNARQCVPRKSSLRVQVILVGKRLTFVFFTRLQVSQFHWTIAITYSLPKCFTKTQI